MNTSDAAPDLFARYKDKTVTAVQAVRKIRAGQCVFVGTACGSPRALMRALEELPDPPADVKLFDYLTTDVIPHDEQGRCTTSYRHRTLFVGSDMRAAVRQGLAEYVPLPVGNVAQLIENGRIPIDVALVQVSPPDEFGYVSLGISVDIAYAAVSSAKMVIAEVNPNMPRTMGDSALHVDRIDFLVPVDTPLTEYVHSPVENEVVERVARYIAGVIEDGSTLQIGLGRIPTEALKYLEDRRDLGIHSDVITDSIIPLLEKGILTGRQKTKNRGQIVTSFAQGTRRLCDLIDQPFYVGFAVGGFELGLVPDAAPGDAGAQPLWGVDDIESEVVRLLSLGATPIDPVVEVGDGIKVAAVRDPFGNRLGLIENPHFRAADVR